MDATEALKELAEPRPAGDPVKAAVERAARRVRSHLQTAEFIYSRAYEIWYGRARRIEPFEAEAITAALQQKREHDARNELHDLKLRIAKLEARLAAGDTDFYRPRVAVGELAIRGVR
jgi:hypothetical protein